jgi:putative proteasome-type protease
MTYCLALHCREGLAFFSDSRTSAGVDNITIHSKMRIYARGGDRVFCLLSSGNLSSTQAVGALIERDLAGEGSHLLNQPDLFETARYVGERVREVRRMDAEALHRSGLAFNVNFVLGGQIAGQPMRIFQIYPEGNFIHASQDSPFLQIGELKYGKPILDRGFTCDTSLAEAVKYGLLSLDATARSNLSVGTPFEIFLYHADSLQAGERLKLQDDDPYLTMVRERWQAGLIELVRTIPGLEGRA